MSGALAVTGNMAVSPGAGENTFTSNLLGGRDEHHRRRLQLPGGANGDAVSLDNTTVGRNATVALGESFGSGVASFAPGCTGPGR